MSSDDKLATLVFRVLFSLVLAVVLATCMAVGDLNGMGVMDEKAPEQLGLNCKTTYNVVAGDTCFDIAQQFNLTLAELLAINPGINCDDL
ncbi:hypothetical protein MLD38_010014 [Melastoma candidum]|uniref:Uncharacterized protein n=1 Tax=Melastoma candidum TaxID=119954 RepID=A0ACB9R1K3_9MYRT|nr:hypothetical protein MLD38_010014 [Melastoma candidum]